MEIKTYLNDRRLLVEDALQKQIVSLQEPFSHHIEAMHYSLFAGGKRVRPILCLAAGEALDDSSETQKNLLPASCALECIHTYSLIHDDLPAMDNDDLRRGKPTNHKLFGEAEAILAGDSLLTWAFDLISNPENTTLPPQALLKMTHCLARAAGPLGMVGGQSLDIANEKREFPFETLQVIHKNKTGALITAAVRMGAIGAAASEDQLQALTDYGDKIGLAFQIVDDLLNVTSTTEQLGKAVGSDEEKGKATYPAYFGVEKTRQIAQETVEQAINALRNFDTKADPLRLLAQYIFTRSN